MSLEFRSIGLFSTVIQPTETTPVDYSSNYNHSAKYLACSSKYGILFVVSASGQVKYTRTKDINDAKVNFYNLILVYNKNNVFSDCSKINLTHSFNITMDTCPSQRVATR
jgi:hypothetical protein